MELAKIYDFQDYRSRQALRDCGTASRSRQFLWVDPRNGSLSVRMFRPATATPMAALQSHAGRAG
jgi:hypothetical protein